MLKSIHVIGLNGKLEHKLKFHPDLNLITGLNGSGKTTLLKLLWYSLSGNIERIPSEISFDTVDIVGDTFRVRMKWLKKKVRRGVIRIKAEGKGRKPIEQSFPLASWERKSDAIDRVNHLVASCSEKSFFFPTFRRIEGGFAINPGPQYWDEDESLNQDRASQVRASLEQYTELISVYDHKFIASISTDDVQQLLTRQYADAAERSNKLHLLLTDSIIATIKKHKASKDSALRSKRSERVLNDIHRRIEKLTRQREIVMKPFTVLEQTIKGVFHHKGIRLSEAIVFGDKKHSVLAEQLSAGEKQMLSFLVYNAFTRNAVFFIDEPEISLHADWQRQLFGLLLKQDTGNQFIAATHSPFIYSKYPEKEHALSLEKGE